MGERCGGDKGRGWGKERGFRKGNEFRGGLGG